MLDLSAKVILWEMFIILVTVLWVSVSIIKDVGYLNASLKYYFIYVLLFILMLIAPRIFKHFCSYFLIWLSCYSRRISTFRWMWIYQCYFFVLWLFYCPSIRNMLFKAMGEGCSWNVCRYYSSVKLVGWLFRFHGISTFIGYLIPNPFLYK